jgi:hypothetical protein
MAKVNKIEFQAADVWAAACAAQRVNGAYIKPAQKNIYGVMPTNGTPNRELMMGFLTTNPETITQADRDHAEVVRRYYQALEFSIIKGKALSDFDRSALEAASQDVVTSFLHIAVIASLPSCHERAIARDSANQRVTWAKGGFIGKVGDKVTLDIEVVKSIYSMNYNVHFVTGITEQEQVVFFSYRESMMPGTKLKVRATVKAHRDNSTQLTRTKVL